MCAPSCEWWWSELFGRKVVLRVRMPVTEQLFVVIVTLCEWLVSLGRCTALLSRPGCGCYRCSRYLYRWSTTVQMEHQRNLGYMGFMVIGSPSPLCDVLCDRGFRWVAGSVGRFFLQSFLPFDGPCLVLGHHLVSWSAPSEGERDLSHPWEASLCACGVVTYHCG